MKDMPHAILDREDDTRVLCCRCICGGVRTELAVIEEITVEPPRSPRVVLPLNWSPVSRSILITPGWKQREDGVLVLTRYAARRVERGLSPKYRRGIPTHSADGERVPDRPPDQDYRRIAAPADIKCPRCGLVQQLDAATLRLSPDSLGLPPNRMPRDGKKPRFRLS